jgi:hypothetical protein
MQLVDIYLTKATEYNCAVLADSRILSIKPGVIQGDSGGNVSILESDSIGQMGKESPYGRVLH